MSDPLSGFMHIWEVPVFFKCPVVGAVLSVERHRKILQKCGYDVTGLKPYEYHQVIMSRLHEKNKVSVKVDSYIRNKARPLMIRMAKMDEEQIGVLWHEHLESGRVGNMLYAIACLKRASDALLNDVHGEVHMLSHANMRLVFNLQRKLAGAEACVERLKTSDGRKRAKVREMVQARKAEDENRVRLETRNLQLEDRVKQLEAKLAVLSSATGDVPRLENRNQALGEALDAQKHRYEQLRKRQDRLENKLFHTRNENALLEKELHELVDGVRVLEQESGFGGETSCGGGQACARCRKACGKGNGCPGRVFMIGGIERLHPLYRGIVERGGGKLDYHDGRLRGGSVELEARVMRSDVVLCPVNCNSHNACLRVKKLCNRHNKCLKMLGSSSISAVTQALYVKDGQGRQTVAVLN